jgi:hypothetical protein
VREIVILMVAIIVGGAMMGTLTWFFRRLRRIEEETLGMAVEPPLGTQVRELGALFVQRFRKR